jgi:hypothetical protein
MLGRLTAGGWRIRGLTYRVDLVELDPDALALVMTILDDGTLSTPLGTLAKSKT